MITALFCAQLSIAAKIEVTNTNDSGSGSLRWAVSNANWKDTITFSNTTNNSPINLTTGFVLLNKSITIQGNGLGTTILDGNVNSNIFYSDNTGSNNDTINIQKLTIQNGVNTTYGGGGYNDVAGAQHTGFIVNFSEVEFSRISLVGDEANFVELSSDKISIEDVFTNPLIFFS